MVYKYNCKQQSIVVEQIIHYILLIYKLYYIVESIIYVDFVVLHLAVLTYLMIKVNK